MLLELEELSSVLDLEALMLLELEELASVLDLEALMLGVGRRRVEKRMAEDAPRSMRVCHGDLAEGGP